MTATGVTAEETRGRSCVRQIDYPERDRSLQIAAAYRKWCIGTAEYIASLGRGAREAWWSQPTGTRAS